MSRRNRASWAPWALSASLVAAAALPGTAGAVSLVVDVTGIQSRDETPSAANQSFNYQIGAGSSVVGISYDVTLQANSPSWLSEMGVAITDSSGTGGIQLFPGFGSNAAGTQRYTGSLVLASLGLDVTAGADGVLKLEFFEAAADDLTPDGVWLTGTLTLDHVAAVPEPGTYAMLLAGLAAVSLVRRGAGQRTAA